MKKPVKIILGIVLLILLVWVLAYFKKSNTAEVLDYKVDEPYFTSIDYKVVATGKLNPEEEIELKPQISGIVDIIVVEEGDIVQKGDLIAKIRVVPNEQALVSANSRIKTTQFTKDNAQILYDRNKALFEKGVISKQDFENSELSLNQAVENLKQAQNDYQIIRQGSLSGGSSANTNIVAQIAGTENSLHCTYSPPNSIYNVPYRVCYFILFVYGLDVLLFFMSSSYVYIYIVCCYVSV